MNTILIINSIALCVAVIACVAAIITIVRAERKLWKYDDSIFMPDKEDK